jgi:hypothetical protein
MPLARIGSVLLYFAHIPKTGGSSVEAYLRQKGPLAGLQSRTHGWSRTTFQHAHRTVFADLFREGFCDAGFTIVRDPIARLASAYRMRVSLGDTHGPARRLPRPVRRLVQAALPEPRSPLPVDAWVPRVFSAYARNPYLHDNHIRPQAEFVDPSHRVFRFEAGLDPVFDWIDAVTGTQPAPERPHHRRSEPVPVEASEATEASIRAFYAADYDMLARLREPAMAG